MTRFVPRFVPAHRPAGDEGFTLLEMLVVIAIIGLLMAIVGPQVLNQLSKAKTHAAKIQIVSTANALDEFQADVGRYPSQGEGLAALTVAPAGANGWAGPYSKAIPADPWGHPYHYLSPGKHGEFDLYTLGSDDAEGGTGAAADVGNWQGAQGG
ncbi:MAG: type II secretion system major pseudopilin GspG [Caulobacteraceae bacterium]